MKMKSALLVIGAVTIFLGLTNFSTSALQERVSTCETRLNNNQLQLINTLQQMSSNEVKISQQVISKQIERATGVPGPTDQNMEDLFRRMVELGQTAMRSTESMQQLLNEACEEQRSQWFLFSVIAVLLNSLVACLAFWLGLRVVAHDGQAMRDGEE
jgi:hypothetical protein